MNFEYGNTIGGGGGVGGKMQEIITKVGNKMI